MTGQLRVPSLQKDFLSYDRLHFTRDCAGRRQRRRRSSIDRKKRAGEGEKTVVDEGERYLFAFAFAFFFLVFVYAVVVILRCQFSRLDKTRDMQREIGQNRCVLERSCRKLQVLGSEGRDSGG